jgi:hypothetical protein
MSRGGRHLLGLAVALPLLGAAAASDSTAAEIWAVPTQQGGGWTVELFADYDHLTVDLDAQERLAQDAEVPVEEVADPVQALFSTGLVLAWNDASITLTSFAFDAEAPVSELYRFGCPDSPNGCDDFDDTPAPGRRAFGVGIGDFEGILTEGEERVAVLSFDTSAGGDPQFALTVDRDNQFANAPRIRLLDFDTLIGIDACTGQPPPDDETPPCRDTVSFADVEQVDSLTLRTHYDPQAVPEASAASLACASLLTLVALRGRSRPRA